MTGDLVEQVHKWSREEIFRILKVKDEPEVLDPAVHE